MDYPTAEHVTDSPFKRGARFIGKAAWSGLKTSGKAIGKAGKWTAGKVGNGTIIAAEKAGSAAITAGKYGAKGAAILGVDFARSLNVTDGPMAAFRNPVGTAARGTGNFLGKLVEYEPETRVYNETTGKLTRKMGGFKATKLGMGVILGIGLLGGMNKAVDTHIGDRMGRPSPKMQTLTPDYNPVQYQTSMPDDMGATGDLVFALHNNR